MRIVVPLVKDFGQLKKDVEQIYETFVASSEQGNVDDAETANKLKAQKELIEHVDETDLPDESKADLAARLSELQAESEEISNEIDGQKKGGTTVQIKKTSNGGCQVEVGTTPEEDVKSFKAKSNNKQYSEAKDSGKEKDKDRSYKQESSEPIGESWSPENPHDAYDDYVPEPSDYLKSQKKGVPAAVARKIEQWKENAKQLERDYPNAVYYGKGALIVGSTVAVGAAAAAAVPVVGVAGSTAVVGAKVFAAGSAILRMGVICFATSEALTQVPKVVESTTGQTPKQLAEKGYQHAKPALDSIGIDREDAITIAGALFTIAETTCNKVRRGGVQQGGHHHHNNNTTTTTTTDISMSKKSMPHDDSCVNYQKPSKDLGNANQNIKGTGNTPSNNDMLGASTKSKMIRSIDDLEVGKKLLPGEGKVDTFKKLDKIGVKGDNLTPNHIPQAAYMKKYGISRDDGIAMMMEQPAPGIGGRHRKTRTYGRQPDLSATPRQELARDITDVRNIYKKDGVYTTEIKGSLKDVICENKNKFPNLFDKK